jgi:uncharacterized protein YjbI with pentapeptide repeats
MEFVLVATPCPKCGAHTGGEFDYRGGDSTRGGQEGILSAPCGTCGTLRELHFHEQGDLFAVTPEAYELGGPEPSTVMDPGQLMAEHDRVALAIADDPPANPAPARDALDRALTAVVEIAKFIPAGAEDVPAKAFTTEAGRLDGKLRPTRYRRSWLDAQKKKYLALEKRYTAAASAGPGPAATAAGTLDDAALEAHLQWVRRGGKGGGRLALRGTRAEQARIGAKELSGAMLVDVGLDGADLAFSTLKDAQLDEVSFARARLESASLSGARIVRCKFDGAQMVLVKLGDASVERSSFVDAELDRSTWYRATVRECDLRKARFGNAAFDRAVFTDCDLRGAQLALHDRQPLGTAFKTRFERCDLRDTTWADRDLGSAEFVDCKLDGAAGKPHFVGGVVVERAELGGRKLDGDAALTALGWK